MVELGDCLLHTVWRVVCLLVLVLEESRLRRLPIGDIIGSEKHFTPHALLDANINVHFCVEMLVLSPHFLANSRIICALPCNKNHGLCCALGRGQWKKATSRILACQLSPSFSSLSNGMSHATHLLVLSKPPFTLFFRFFFSSLLFYPPPLIVPFFF